MEWEKGERHMLTVRPGEIEVEERWYVSDPTMRFKIALPFSAETGNEDGRGYPGKRAKPDVGGRHGTRSGHGATRFGQRGHRDGSGRWFLLSRHGRNHVRATADA